MFLPKDYVVPVIEDSEELQGTEKWHKDRAGRITGSNFEKCCRYDHNLKKKTIRKSFAKEKYNISATAYSYLIHVLWTKKTGIFKEFESKPTNHGNEYEPIVRDVYCEKYGIEISEVGFQKWKVSDRIGISLDGHRIENNTTIEIKNPYSDNFLKYIDSGMVPKEYFAQVQGGLLIYDSGYCDFICADMRMNDLTSESNIFVIRCYRNEKYLQLLKEELIFHLEVMDQIEKDIDNKRNIGIIEQHPNYINEIIYA